jgi:hypothetical protein
MRKFDATRLYLYLGFVTSMLFSMIFVVTSYYEVTVAGLSGLQLVLVGTTVEVTILLFEVPTGVVADAYSRRLSIIIGSSSWAGIRYRGLFPAFILIVIRKYSGAGYLHQWAQQPGLGRDRRRERQPRLPYANHTSWLGRWSGCWPFRWETSP